MRSGLPPVYLEKRVARAAGGCNIGAMSYYVAVGVEAVGSGRSADFGTDAH